MKNKRNNSEIIFKLKNIFIYTLIIFSFIFALGFLQVNSVEARGTSVSTRTCRYTHHCNYGVITKDNVNYNVSGWATYSRPCGQNSFPTWGCNFVKNEILDRLGPSTLSSTWGLACGNTHGFSATYVAVNGACGSATTTPSASFPTANLCNSGTVTATSTGSSHTWTCAGLGAGTSASCSTPITSTFALSCTPSPTTGVVNTDVLFTTTISGTTTSPLAFAYSWTINGVATSTTLRNINVRWPSATTTARVEVVARRGTHMQRAVCPFNRVECGPGLYSCMDQVPAQSYACAATSGACPVSACGITSAKEMDISNNYTLPAGGTLSLTSPSAAYITSNSLCKSDNALRFVGLNTTWSFSPSYSTWRWDCVNPSALSYATCQARCSAGEFFCVESGVCTPNGTSCQCPMSGSPGDFLEQAEACVNDDGTCYACSKVINFFKLDPDEVDKLVPANKCGGYWTTNDIPVAQRPINTVATQVICNMKSATTSYSVIANRPDPGPSEPLSISAYALTCTQQYELSTNPGVWNNLQSHTLEAKCRSTPRLLEK